MYVDFALGERVGQGEEGGYTALADPLFCFLVQTSVENGPFTL